MTNTDRFIEEVTEEVRRDRLFALIRRWGWVVVVVVVTLVGTAAYLEYRRVQNANAAAAFGDAILAALDAPVADERLTALRNIVPPSPQAMVILAFLEAGELAQSGEVQAAGDRLRQAAEDPDLDRRYRDLALLRAETLIPSDDVSETRAILETLAEPGAPYAALAQEQQALLSLRLGDIEGALEVFRRIETAAEATPDLRQRAAQMIVALESGARIIDTENITPPSVPPQGTNAP